MEFDPQGFATLRVTQLTTARIIHPALTPRLFDTCCLILFPDFPRGISRGQMKHDDRRLALGDSILLIVVAKQLAQSQFHLGNSATVTSAAAKGQF
jgi:hypothetical protein